MKFNTYEIAGIGISILLVVITFSVIKFLPDMNFGGVSDNETVEEVEIIRISPEEGQDTYKIANALVDGSTRTGRIIKLVVQDVVVGAGTIAEEGDVVSVSYTGVLEDGFIVDSAEDDEPLTFTLGAGDVIRGWDLGIAGMRVGGERILVIPASLAYGNIETSRIPKNSTLLFSIRLLSVE